MNFNSSNCYCTCLDVLELSHEKAPFDKTLDSYFTREKETNKI